MRWRRTRPRPAAARPVRRHWRKHPRPARVEAATAPCAGSVGPARRNASPKATTSASRGAAAPGRRRERPSGRTASCCRDRPAPVRRPGGTDLIHKAQIGAPAARLCRSSTAFLRALCSRHRLHGELRSAPRTTPSIGDRTLTRSLSPGAGFSHNWDKRLRRSSEFHAGVTLLSGLKSRAARMIWRGKSAFR